ncbi:hypothetical protein [Actinokineospora spheciospongiae]|uniref:hypothetical protein n=1 Tax=Actinokineospora spheciospongiae TaxID=909613 RepID=UPI0012688B7B|nr:hypothetical protein [Actinokineospora spheciospongiae]
MTTVQKPPTLYEDLLWPVTFTSNSARPRLLVGDNVDALSMPAWFGAQVNHHLTLCLLTASILTIPDAPTKWIFLTRRRETASPRTMNALTNMNITTLPPGPLDLPEQISPVDGAHWVTPPLPLSSLPPWTAVVGAARRSFPG